MGAVTLVCLCSPVHFHLCRNEARNWNVEVATSDDELYVGAGLCQWTYREIILKQMGVQNF